LDYIEDPLKWISIFYKILFTLSTLIQKVARHQGHEGKVDQTLGFGFQSHAYASEGFGPKSIFKDGTQVRVSKGLVSNEVNVCYDKVV
jgi:hypothetical protein